MGNDAHGQIMKQQHTTAAGTAPLLNQMLDTLKCYLDNIAAAMKQTVAKECPLKELSVSLTISIDTVVRQKQ